MLLNINQVYYFRLIEKSDLIDSLYRLFYLEVLSQPSDKMQLYILLKHWVMTCHVQARDYTHSGQYQQVPQQLILLTSWMHMVQRNLVRPILTEFENAYSTFRHSTSLLWICVVVAKYVVSGTMFHRYFFLYILSMMRKSSNFHVLCIFSA